MPRKGEKIVKLKEKMKGEESSEEMEVDKLEKKDGGKNRKAEKHEENMY